MDFFGSSNDIRINHAFPIALQDCIDTLASGTKLIIITDFDHTFTTFDSHTCHDLIGEHETYTEGFRTLYKSTFMETNDFAEFSQLWRTSHDMYPSFNFNIYISMITLTHLLFCKESYPTVD
jgi:hypothetical protein